MNLKLQLQTLKKGNLSMKDYLMKMKTICDTLAACGQPISEEDQVLSILAGLRPKSSQPLLFLHHKVIPTV